MVLLWVFFCVAAGLFAVVRRNRNGIGWFFVAFFFSPVVAFVLLLILLPADPLKLAGKEQREIRRATRVGEEAAQAAREAAQTSRVIDHQTVTVGSVPVWLGVIVVALLFATLIGLTAVRAQQTVIRDAAGRTVGTTTQSGNQTVIRNAGGRTIGTSTDYPGTDTVLRDAGGRTIGTVSQGHR